MKSFGFNRNEMESGAVEVLKSVKNCLKMSYNDPERPDITRPSGRLCVYSYGIFEDVLDSPTLILTDTFESHSFCRGSPITLFHKTTPRKQTTVPAFWMPHTVISLSFCPCQIRPSCDYSLSVSSCFGSITACFHSWWLNSVYSALLPTCCELEAGEIYPGTQLRPQVSTFRDTRI